MSLQVNQVAIADQTDTDLVLLGEGTGYVIRPDYRGFGAAPLRTFDRVNPASDGGYGGRDLFDIRRVRLNLDVLGETAADLSAVMTPHTSDTEFQWLRYRMKGMADTRRLKIRYHDFQPHWLNGMSEWEAVCEWRSMDGRFYADTETVVNVGQATTGTGWEFPWVFPWVFGSGGSGTVLLENEGLADTFMVATITGPCGGPRLEHVGLGQQVNMAGLTLGAGETVVVDFQARTVLLNGTSDRYGTLTSASRFFPLSPGSNEIRFATQTGSSATAELRYRSAWNIGGS
jgi:hypothetical protein